MINFLLFLLAIYLLYKSFPLILTWWVRHQHRKYEQKVGDAFERAAREQRAQERGTRIEDNAEDAEYQELKGPREVVAQESFTIEEQVMDADFEDI